jgi:hypothetical protein
VMGGDGKARWTNDPRRSPKNSIDSELNIRISRLPFK